MQLEAAIDRWIGLMDAYRLCNKRSISETGSGRNYKDNAEDN